MMDKQQFVQTIADGSFGLWTNAAQLAIKNDDIDLYLDHWREQYEDEGSRPSVERTLGPELTKHLLKLIEKK